MSTSLKPISRTFLASSTPIRLLIVEDNALSGELLQERLKRSRLNVSGVVCIRSYDQVAATVRVNDFNLAVVGEELDDGNNGLEVLELLKKTAPAVRSILLARSLPQALVLAAFRHGAKGVFCRTQPIQLLCRCIRAVHQGQVWVNSQQMETLISALVENQPMGYRKLVGHRQPANMPFLTKREEEVAALVVEGLTNREIAGRLGIKDHTVGNYLFRCYEKLGLSTRVELVLYMLTERSADQSCVKLRHEVKL